MAPQIAMHVVQSEEYAIGWAWFLPVCFYHPFWILSAECSLSMRLVYPLWINLTAITQLQMKQSRNRRCRCCCWHFMSQKLKKVRHRDHLLQEELGAAATGALKATPLHSGVFVAELWAPLIGVDNTAKVMRKEKTAQASAGSGLSHTEVCAVSEFTPVTEKGWTFCFIPLSAPQNHI